MATIGRAGIVAALVILASGLTSGPAIAGGSTSLCVGGKGCYTTVQAAVDAAKPGSTIRINAGTFAGGVHVKKSLRLVGAGAGRTILRGGESVLQIESTEGRPTVGVSALTITGGVSTQTSGDTFVAYGGGLLIPPAPEYELGADVTLDGVVVSGNRARPTTTYPLPTGLPCPGGEDCPYAGAYGGGIANFGNLVIRNSVIRDNAADGHTSDVAGAGIFSAIGDLRIESSQIVGNRSVPAANEIGRYAEGGGVFLRSGTFTLRSSKVIGNVADLTTAWPAFDNGDVVEMRALGGALHLIGAGTTLIEDSQINDNITRIANPKSDAGAWGVVMTPEDAPSVIRRTVMKGNILSVTAATTEFTNGEGPLIQFIDRSQVSDTTITDNRTTVETTDGPAISVGTLGVFGNRAEADPVSLTRVVVSGNTVSVHSKSASALVVGAGVTNVSNLELRATQVKGNVGKAVGVQATALGGGIWNGTWFPGDPAPQLSALDSRVTANVVSTSPKGGAQGGGIYTDFPVQLDRTRVSGNRPDDCIGCTGTTARFTPGPSSQRLAPQGLGRSGAARSDHEAERGLVLSGR